MFTFLDYQEAIEKWAWSYGWKCNSVNYTFGRNGKCFCEGLWVWLYPDQKITTSKLFRSGHPEIFC